MPVGLFGSPCENSLMSLQTQLAESSQKDNK